MEQHLAPEQTFKKNGYYYFDGAIWVKLVIESENPTITANNGLTKTGDNLKLGGTLLENTTIANAGFNTAITGPGNVGIGVLIPNTKLHIESTANPLTITGLQSAAASDELLTVNSSGVVRKTTIDNILSQKSVPTPAVWTLTNQMNDFLNLVTIGNQVSTPMQLLKNDIPGLTFDAVTNTLTFPSGLYQMTYVYEAHHNNTGCTISSHFVDFPDGAGTARKRVHSTISHNQGLLSNHGGNITYTAKIPTGRTWQIRLGRGQFGNCSGVGNELYASTTQFNIVRLGDQ